VVYKGHVFTEPPKLTEPTDDNVLIYQLIISYNSTHLAGHFCIHCINLRVFVFVAYGLPQLLVVLLNQNPDDIVPPIRNVTRNFLFLPLF